MKVLVLHGPNLNLLGRREPEIYGSQSLNDINIDIEKFGHSLGVVVEAAQSNHEGELIDRIHNAAESGFVGIIINPGGLTHSSVSLRDAIAAVNIPVVEVHLTNIHAREEFRQHSFVSPVAVGLVSGFGAVGYQLALKGLLQNISHS